MKYLKLHGILILIVLLVISCEDEFVLENDFREGFVLNCIIDANSSYNIATISRTYKERDDYPMQNYSDRFVKNADIYIKRGSTEFKLKDSLVTVQVGDNQSADISFYYTSQLTNTLSSFLSLVAILPNGDTLTSQTRVPSRITIVQSRTAKLVPPDDNSDSFDVTWKENDNETENLYYDPRLRIVYYKLEDDEYVRYTEEVPIQYNSINGLRTPQYIKPSYSRIINYSMNIFDEIMKSISGGNEDKSNFFIEHAEIDVYTYDEYLTSYYIGTHLLEPYSVRLDEIDYSNVEGGFGIFGSFDKIEHKLAIDPRYIKSFGYEPYYNK